LNLIQTAPNEAYKSIDFSKNKKNKYWSKCIQRELKAKICTLETVGQREWFPPVYPSPQQLAQERRVGVWWSTGKHQRPPPPLPPKWWQWLPAQPMLAGSPFKPTSWSRGCGTLVLRERRREKERRRELSFLNDEWENSEMRERDELCFFNLLKKKLCFFNLWRK
jgi:hypothetical protein